MLVRRLLPILVLAFACLALAPPAFAAPAQTSAANPANRLSAKPIDAYRYDHARRCYRRPSPGALALVGWLQGHVRGTFWGIMRCERLSGRNFSLHSEGRAVDWHLDVHSPADRAAARGLIRLLLATDRMGNEQALARRMGVQEIIWNCRSWWSGPQGLSNYSVCFDSKGKRRKVSDTLAHRDHIHLGLSKAGARKRTSFWRR